MKTKIAIIAGLILLLGASRLRRRTAIAALGGGAALSFGLCTAWTSRHPMAAFYGEVLGFEERPPLAVPGMRIRQFAAGESLVKIVSMKNPPKGECAPGGLSGATGRLAWTCSSSW